MNGNGGMSTKLPVFDGKNWNRWMKQMIVLFGAQDVLELVTEGYVPVAADATDAQKLAQKDTKKKDQRALFYIHQCVDENVFEKIADSETAKAAWDTLIRCYGGDASVKKVKLQSLRKQYENLNMKNNEKVPEYISRMILITNEMKACGETLSEQVIIEKVLRSLTPQFDYIVVAIEHSKDLSTIKVEELQSSLEAHELRMTERTSEREAEQALKASFVKKDQKQNRHGRAQMSEAFYSDMKKYQKRKEKSDKKNVQCYCCKNFGHYANDCRSNKERESEEANMARSSDDEPVLLMAYESDDDEPVKLTFSDSEEVSEDDYEIGVRLYDSESESEVSEDESESEDDSEDEEVSEPEGDESEDEGDSEGSDSEGSDSEGDSEGGSEGASEPEGGSEGGSDGASESQISEARASEGESSEVRRSEVPRRLAEFDMLQDAEVDSKGEVVQCAMLEDSEPVRTEEALKQKVCLKATKEELETLISQVQNEVLEDAHCSIQKQLADALTKDVKAEYFIHLRDGISVAKGELAEYELRDGAGTNSYSEAVRRRNFCGHYSEAVWPRNNRASEASQKHELKQKKKQKLKLKQKKRPKQKEKQKQKQKLKLKEKQKARSKQKLLMRIQKSKSLFNFWNVGLCVNIN
ncbi:hypothetical protein QL285_060140 [Trifolium repens]|nr:hypothetical protein QL285_060140 [Trifolium repens]